MTTQLEREQKLDDKFVMHTFKRKPVEFVSGQGAHLFDSEGKEYIDFLSGIGVSSMGYSCEQLKTALHEQVDKLLHASNYFYVEHRGRLAERISAMLGTTSHTDWQVFFANSGAEANEGAIKLARLWGRQELDGAFGIVTLDKSFHGRTLATLAATAQDAKQDPFAPLPAGFASVPINDIDALEAVLDSEFDGTKPCALLLECIQGESGVWPCTKEYLQAARTLTEERNMLLIVDEVQTGFCRTGAFFAFQHFGIVPDIVSMAKGIGGGVPMGAFAAQPELAGLMQPGMHGTTFGGGPLVCAAADAVTQLMVSHDFLFHIEAAGEFLRQQLSTLPFVTEVRGMGLMLGITLEEPVAAKLVDIALEHGLVLNAPAADIVRFLPPLVIERADIDALIARLPECYEEACA